MLKCYVDIMQKSSFVFLIIVLTSFIARADLCLTTFEQDSSQADIIFVGKVINIDEGAFWHRGDPLEIFTFEIKESFKGLYKSREIVSILGPAYGCCNVHFKTDSTYLVFAYADGENSRTYWTNDCSLSGLLAETQEYYQKLGEPLVPDGNGWSKNYFRKKKVIEDSVSQAQVKLLNNYATEQKKASYLMYTVIGLCLVIFLLLISRIRTKST